ncbi:AAA family ATPase [Modestobacter sp. Leaf380]|uniref:AAA family ATPase n=1 Tax=Modestobacter sp. Leaf380 TaxID=1736356 RepID=UPI000701A56A|nr:AAA family ATPase [Modestobacter sp. Leaf380]KQS66658.1 ATP-binding protein [Modestobacter sp. Leaf380]
MTEHFMATREHRRFAEFAGAVRKQRTIGICFGPAGVGKTVSARRYAQWEAVGPVADTWGPRSRDVDQKAYTAASRARTVLYTPQVGGTLKALREDIQRGQRRVDICIGEALADQSQSIQTTHAGSSQVEMIVVDEAERLSSTGIEWLRDHHDRTSIALILIGMPGIEKQFARYPQLYSRIGFAHQYRPLGNDELLFVLDRYWRRLGRTLNPEDFTDAQAVAAIQRITRGNFRLLERLLPQIQRILKINELDTITDDVIEAARSTLVIGTT